MYKKISTLFNKVRILLYLLSFIVLILIPITLFLKLQNQAESLASRLWIILFANVAFETALLMYVPLEKNRKKILLFTNKIDKKISISVRQIYKRYEKFFLLVCTKRFLASFIVIISLLAGFSNTYYLGGDDSRLFYIYPLDFYKNYVSKIGPDTAPSSFSTFLPPTSIASLILPLIVLKTILGNLNLQMFLYTANILGALVSFYILISYLISKQVTYGKFIKILGSFMYVFSIFNFYTLFNSQLIAIFLLSTFPLSLYFYIRGIKEKKKYFLIIAAIIWTIFCYFSVAVSWFAGAIIAISILLIFLLSNSKWHFIKYNIFFLIILMLLNFHWLSILSYSALINKGNGPIESTITSEDFRRENEEGIKSIASNNKVFYPLLNSYHYDIQKNYNWPYLSIYLKWYSKILPFNIIFISVFLLTGIFLLKNKIRNNIFIASFISFTIAVYLFTVNIGNWGIELFLLLNRYIPGFVMFRNMYDKLAYSLALCFAILFVISLIHLFEKPFSILTKKFILLFISFIIFLNALPFLLNKFNRLPIWTTVKTYNSIRGLNKDFLDLVQFIKNNDNSSRYLWIPLNHGAISQIQDKILPNHYYNGVSPILMLTGKNDYSGLMSFGSYAQEMKDNFFNKRYAAIGYLFRKFNVKYIIVNHTINSDIRQSYICSEGLCDTQNEEYKKIILGKKIKDFGTRYSLYGINDQFANDKFYVTDDLTEFPINSDINVSYKRISDHQYNITISHVKRNQKLVFLDPYFSEWGLYSENNTAISKDLHYQVFSYANAWDLKINIIKSILPKSEYKENKDRSLDVSLYLIFKINPFYKLSVLISIITFIISILYIIFIQFFKKIKYRKF